MGDPRYPWSPVTLDDARAIFGAFPGPWWVAGGWAIDLHIGRQTRKHEDTDVLIRRSDHLALHDVLPGWEIRAAGRPTESKLELWKAGVPFPPDVHDIWCRPRPDADWALQIMLVDTQGQDWLFRRDSRIRGSLAGMGLERDGLPYLAPEIQLLYKSKHPRPKDEADFRAILPYLVVDPGRWLAQALALHDPGNPWRKYLPLMGPDDHDRPAQDQ